MLTTKLYMTPWASDLKLFVKKSSSQIFNYAFYRNIYNAQNITEKARNLTEKTDSGTKLIKVAIIGLPNAGKSTLINHMMDRKVCPTSNKVHTTRKRSHSIITEGKTQIVFLDTPGIISNAEQRRYKLEKSFFKDCDNSLTETDVIGVVHDVSNVWTRDRLDIKIIRLLERYKKKSSFLILNKIDELKSKRKLLDVTKNLIYNPTEAPTEIANKKLDKNETYRWGYFSEVFMISALYGDGVEDIKNYLIKKSRSSPWMYPPVEWTDQTPEDIVVKTVQAVLLDFLPQEIPYGLKTELEFMEISDEGKISAVVLVNCPQERIRKLVVGVGDGKLRQITEKVQRDLLSTFHSAISLRIVVSCDSKNK